MRTRKILSTLAAAGAALALAAGPASANHEGTSYEGTLTEMNGSGASGDTYVTVSDDGESIEVGVNATNLNLDGPHAMHIHGLVEGENVMASSCPPADADEDGNDVVDTAEGIPFYGSVQISLTTEGDTSAESALAVERFPAGTSVDYLRSEIPLDDPLKPNVDKLHVVVHGLDMNGNGSLDMDQEERSSLTEDLPLEATAPALCGELTAVAGGPVQTGGGGTADSDINAAAAAGLGIFALGGLALARRRKADVTA